MKNYSLETEKEILSLNGKKPRLLLHSCCGPCSAYVLEYLSSHFEITVLFYNPNIQPESEYELRLHNQMLLLKEFPQVRILTCDYITDEFNAAIEGLEKEPEGGIRCRACIELRLRETAKTAKKMDFEYFCSTLSVSPQKNANMINEIGERLSDPFLTPAKI